MYKFTYDLKPELNGQLPLYNGHLIYAAYLRIINSKNPHFAEMIHTSKTISPFAMTILRPIGRRAEVTQGFMKIRTDTLYRTSITILDDNMTELIDLFGTLSNIKIKLGLIPFIVSGLQVKYVPYKTHVEEHAKYKSLIRVHFLTPTQLSIRESRQPIILPRPELILNNLARIWNSFSGINVDSTTLYEWCEKNVYVREVDIVSREVDIGKKVKQVGFKGHVAFRVNEGDYAEWINILLKFGEFSNVGVKRTFGMGVIQVLDTKMSKKNPSFVKMQV